MSKNNLLEDKLRNIYKDIEDYSKIDYPVHISYNITNKEYIAYFPDLDQLKASGKTIQEALDNANLAKIKWINEALYKKEIIPIPFEYYDVSGSFRIRMPKELHETLTLQAKKRGISLNKYCIELLRKG